MSEPFRKPKSDRRSWLELLAQGAFELLFMGLCALGTVAATRLFHLESQKTAAQGAGVALAMLFIALAVMVTGLIWAYRMSNTTPPGR